MRTRIPLGLLPQWTPSRPLYLNHGIGGGIIDLSGNLPLCSFHRQKDPSPSSDSVQVFRPSSDLTTPPTTTGTLT